MFSALALLILAADGSANAVLEPRSHPTTSLAGSEHPWTDGKPTPIIGADTQSERLRAGVATAGAIRQVAGSHGVQVGHSAYRWSVAALVAASAADAASSYGRVELNPILGRGTFGTRQISIKAAIIGGSLAVQWLVIRKRPDSVRAWKWVNWLAAGGTGAVAANNWRTR